MVRQEEGRWDVSVKSNAVCVERISDSDKQVFEDLLAPQEARELAGLLTKYADKADESEESDKSENSDKSEDSHESEDSDDSEGTDESENTDKSEDSDESDD